ncbi:MAG: hypothetical protein KDJ52_14485 [Anaerolineae bacterium]|nr:hypothetical protein [Anaerolineae bacterium]
MILINLTHPSTAEQRQAIEAMTHHAIDRLIEWPAQFNVEHAFSGQISTLVDSLGLTPAEWQQLPLIVLPPSLNFGTAALLAELHGRCGYFPPIIRTRPVPDSLPPRYEVAEVINLQALREQARLKR